MLKKYLVTMQQPSCARSRYIVKATGTFDALDKVMTQMLKSPQPLDADSYLAARPATAEDIAKYGEWMV
jgi:hypothetical protein